MSYVEDARIILEEELPSIEPSLMDLYLLLLLAFGGEVNRERVHDAWAIWKDATVGEHPAPIPFDMLDQDTQDKDQEYVDGIVRAAARLETFKRMLAL